MRIHIIIGVFAVLATLLASGEVLPDALSGVRVIGIKAAISETVLLSPDEKVPRSILALNNGLRRVYIREGDTTDGFLAVKVDKTKRVVTLQKGDVVTTVQFGPAGVQTNLSAILTAMNGNSFRIVKVGDRIEKEWAISFIGANGVVMASNSVGKVHVIQLLNKVTWNDSLGMDVVQPVTSILKVAQVVVNIRDLSLDESVASIESQVNATQNLVNMIKIRVEGVSKADSSAKTSNDGVQQTGGDIHTDGYGMLKVLASASGLRMSIDENSRTVTIRRETDEEKINKSIQKGNGNNVGP